MREIFSRKLRRALIYSIVPRDVKLRVAPTVGPSILNIDQKAETFFTFLVFLEIGIFLIMDRHNPPLTTYQ